MRRVLVVGCPGAGKSTFARRLGERLSLPVIHLDLHYWHPGWRPSESTQWREKCAALAAAPDWVMDGAYSSTYDIRMPRADTLLWLDYPRHTCLRRVLWRLFKHYGRRNRPDLPEGCPERFDPAFVRFVWNFPKAHRPRIVAAIERHGGHLRVTRFVRDRKADAFLRAHGAS
jgi:adenylate kinase family enzyme